MKIKRILLVAVFAALIFSLLPFCVSAANEADRIYDFKDLIADGELSSLLSDFEDKTGLKIRIVTTDDETFSLSDIGLSPSDDAVILEIIKIGGAYYYEFYTYGDAIDRILDSELDRILDAPEVYDNLKSGNFNNGINAFLALTEKAYLGNLQEPIWESIVISLIIASVIGGITAACVAARYKRKLKAPSYPIERYTSLILDHDMSRDSFITTRIIKTRVNTSSGGRGGSGGRGFGGGSRGRR